MHAVITRRDGTTYTRPIDTIPDMHAAFFEALEQGQRGLDAVQDGNTTRCDVESLEDLLEILTLCYEDAPVVVGAAKLEDLPTFGIDRWPLDKGRPTTLRRGSGVCREIRTKVAGGWTRVWSWDDDRMLVGGAVHDLRIVTRRAAP